jgi:hypothetical protein
MSVESKMTCDHCGATPLERIDGPWPTIEVASGMARTHGLHVCPACVSALAAFFKQVPRDLFAGHATHHAVLEFAATQRTVPNAAVALTLHPEVAFKPRRFELQHAAEWFVDDVVIGNRPQFAAPSGKKIDGIPGEVFGSEAIDNLIKFETVHPLMDFKIIATYIGTNPEGALFLCKVHGVMAGFAPELKSS